MSRQTRTSTVDQELLTYQSHARRPFLTNRRDPGVRRDRADATVRNFQDRPKRSRGLTAAAIGALFAAACTSASEGTGGTNGDTAVEGTGPSIAAVTPAPASEGEQTTGEQKTLRIATWDENQSPTQEKYIAAFEASHPDVTIELEVLTFRDYVQTLQTAQTGGDGYDIIWINAPNVATFVANDILLPLDDFVAADNFDTTVFPQGLVDMYTVDDSLYAISKDFDTIGLFYNKAAFAEAGLAAPTNDWTWDDLAAAAAELTNEERKGFAAVPYEQELVFPLIFSADGDPLTQDRSATDLDSAAACSALEFLASFHTNGSSPDIATLDTTWYVEDFIAGKVAMVTTGSWDTKQIVEQMGDNVGLVEFPAGARDANLIHGLGWAIMSTSDHPDIAWEYIKSISTQEAHELQARDGVAIPSYAGTAKIWTDTFTELDATVFTDAAATADPFPVASADGGWTSEMYSALSDQLNTDPGGSELCSRVDTATNTYIADHPVA